MSKKKNQKSKKRTGKVLLGAAIGAIGGTIVGIATAPKHSKEAKADTPRRGKVARKTTANKE
jgi:gas vesicle protein